MQPSLFLNSNDLRNAIFSYKSAWAFVDHNRTITLVNLETGEEKSVYDTDGGEIGWLDGQTYFALIGEPLTVNTVDGTSVTLLDYVHDYYRLSPQLAFETTSSHFPPLEPHCPGLAPLHLQVGQLAHVIPATAANNMRNFPRLNSDIIGQVPAGQTMNVLSGPVCRENIVWWKVKYQTIVGWTAELQGNDYFIEPLD